MMQTSVVAQRKERSSTQVDDILAAHSRRRVSGSIGKKHFNLAPGVLQSSYDDSQSSSSSSTGSSRHAPYDEAWERWMQQGARASTVTYDEAWLRWFSKHDQNNARAAQLAAAPSTAVRATTTPASFAEVPRQATRPIMSRLPLSTDEEDDVAANATKAGVSLDYLTTAAGTTGGVHDDADASGEVTYSRARLPVLDDESTELWRALHALRGISDDYADGYAAPTGPTRGSKATVAAAAAAAAPHPIAAEMDISQCPAFNANDSTGAQRALALVRRMFNWDDLPSLPLEDEYVWYGVAFRSKRRAGSESMNLYEADRRSHEEAVDSGGLLMYWYGAPNPNTGHNLATCIWTNRDDALRASSLPLHARAAAHAAKAYESFELNRYALRKVKGESRLRLEEWSE